MGNLNVRVYLWVALALLLFYDYQAWLRDYPPAAPPALSAPSGTGQASPASSELGSHIPQGGATAAPAEHAAAAPAATVAAAASATVEPAAPVVAPSRAWISGPTRR